MRRNVKMAVTDLDLIVRRRLRIHPVLLGFFVACLLVMVAITVARLIAGLPPLWALVIAATGFWPVIDWVEDYFKLRKFDARYLTTDDSETDQ